MTSPPWPGAAPAPAPRPPVAPLTPSSILAGRKANRPGTGMIVTMAAACVGLVVVLLIFALQGPSVAIALVFALGPLPVFVWAVLALDKAEPEPWEALLVAVLWGAGIATLFALVVNTVAEALVWDPLLGAEAGSLATATFVAPVVEEVLKGAVLLGLFWWRRSELNGLTDGVVYAALVGLGFAAVENVLYYSQSAQYGALGSTLFLRGIASPLAHPIFTSLTGIGVAVAAGRARGRVGPIIGGLAGAIAMHALWNGSTGFGLLGLAFAWLVGLGVLITVLRLLARDRAKLLAVTQWYLPRYFPTGLATPEDVAMLASTATRRRALAWVRSARGPAAARALRDYQLAATKLTQLYLRHDTGFLDEQAFHARRLQLEWLMGVTRPVFLVR